MNVRERSGWIVVVTHETVVVVPVRSDLIDDEACLLHGRAAVLKLTAHLRGGLLERAI